MKVKRNIKDLEGHGSSIQCDMQPKKEHREQKRCVGLVICENGNGNNAEWKKSSFCSHAPLYTASWVQINGGR